VEAERLVPSSCTRHSALVERDFPVPATCTLSLSSVSCFIHDLTKVFSRSREFLQPLISSRCRFYNAVNVNGYGQELDASFINVATQASIV
jgi:hypothetical protein